MPTQKPRNPRVRKPLSNWDRTSPGLRAALIMTPILFFLFLMNSVGIGIFSTSGIAAGMICYPVQILAYVANGMLAGNLGRTANLAANPVTGNERQHHKKNRPNYMKQGALAGLLLGLVAIAIYFVVGASASSLIPGIGIFLSVGAPSLFLFLIVDLAIAIGAGILGGIIYGQIDH